MRIRIDRAACTGHGRCYALAPALIEDDEQGYGQVRDDGLVADSARPAAEAAVQACPESAVHLEA